MKEHILHDAATILFLELNSGGPLNNVLSRPVLTIPDSRVKRRVEMIHARSFPAQSQPDQTVNNDSRSTQADTKLQALSNALGSSHHCYVSPVFMPLMSRQSACPRKTHGINRTQQHKMTTKSISEGYTTRKRLPHVCTYGCWSKPLKKIDCVGAAVQTTVLPPGQAILSRSWLHITRC